MYGTEVKKLMQQVKRNIEIFPDDFMIQLTIEEANKYSRSQNVTLNEHEKNMSCINLLSGSTLENDWMMDRLPLSSIVILFTCIH